MPPAWWQLPGHPLRPGRPPLISSLRLGLPGSQLRSSPHRPEPQWASLSGPPSSGPGHLAPRPLGLPCRLPLPPAPGPFGPHSPPPGLGPHQPLGPSSALQTPLPATGASRPSGHVRCPCPTPCPAFPHLSLGHALLGGQAGDFLGVSLTPPVPKQPPPPGGPSLLVSAHLDSLRPTLISPPHLVHRVPSPAHWAPVNLGAPAHGGPSHQGSPSPQWTITSGLPGPRSLTLAWKQMKRRRG